MVQRIFYGCQGIFISDLKRSQLDVFIHGVQSLSVNQTYDNESFPDMGRSQLVYNPYIQPTNQITIDRILSNLTDTFGCKIENVPTTYAEGYLLNQNNLGYSVLGDDATDISQYDISVIYGSDTDETLSATALDLASYKRCLLTNASFNFSISEPFSSTLQYSNKIVSKDVIYSVVGDDEGGGGDQYITDDGDLIVFGSPGGGLNSSSTPSNDLPLSPSVLTRKDFDKFNSVLPTEVLDFINLDDFIDGEEIYGLTSISVDLGINYRAASDIGRWPGSVDGDQVNLYTQVSLPLDITCTFTVTARRAQQFYVANSNVNFDNSQIRLAVKLNNADTQAQEYDILDLGTKNIFTGMSISGGDTGGGLVEYQFNYKNVNNDFSVYRRTDTDFGAADQTTEKY